jgi:hypothetical protein
LVNCTVAVGASPYERMVTTDVTGITPTGSTASPTRALINVDFHA